MSREVWKSFAEELGLPVFKTLLANKDIPSKTKEPHDTNNFEGFARTAYSLSSYVSRNQEEAGALGGYLVDCLNHVLKTFDLSKMCRQNLIEYGYLSQMFIRNPSLFQSLEKEALSKFLAALQKLKDVMPLRNNYVLMWGLAQAFYSNAVGNEEDVQRVVAKILGYVEPWYKGDALFGDGADNQTNYYNSLVIYPAIDCLLKLVTARTQDGFFAEERWKAKYLRHVEIMARMISPEGTYPVVGRSACYRTGVFHSISCYLLDYKGSDVLRGVTSGITSVLEKLHPNIFDEDGFLRIGFNGVATDRLSEFYICTGSLYAAGLFLQLLGTEPANPVWEKGDWIQKRIWEGRDAPIDASIGDPIDHFTPHELNYSVMNQAEVP